MSVMSWLNTMEKHRAFAVIRSAHFEVGIEMANAVAEGGLRLIEITWNSERPAELVAYLRQTLPHCWIGAGTLLKPEDVQQAIAAGAQFLFTPHTNPALIQLAVRAQVPIIPGALTPSEIVTAWQAGASSVKVFPIQAVGGTAYLTALRGPLTDIPLIPTGGVTLDNAIPLIQAGAIAVGLAGDLFPKNAVQTGDWDLVRRRARLLSQKLSAVIPAEH